MFGTFFVCKNIANSMLKNSQKKEIAFLFLLGNFFFFCFYAPFYWNVVSCAVDYSKDSLFTLSVATKKLIKSLDGPILIEVLDIYKKEDIGHSLLNKISAANKNIKVDFVNIYKMSREKENFVKGTIRFSKDSSPHSIELLPKDLWGNNGESLHEQKFSRTLKTFVQTDNEEKSVRFLFLKENGERRISDHGPNGLSELARLIRACGFVTQEYELSSKTVEQLLDTDILVIFGPRKSVSLQKKSLLVDQMMDKKRNLLLFLDPSSDSGFQEVGLEDMVAFKGVSYRDGLLVDRENFAKISSSAGSIFFPILTAKSSLFSDVLEKQLGEREYKVAFFSGRSIVVKDDPGIITILETSSRAYEERDVESLQKSMSSPNGVSSVFYDAGIDRVGPLVGGVAIHKNDDQRIICLGDSGFAANRVIESYDNAVFLLSCFLWSAKKEFLLYSAPHKSMTFPRFFLPLHLSQILYLIRLILMPTLPLLFFLGWIHYKGAKP